MTDLHWLGAAEAARLIRGKQLSPVELVRALLDRIERLNPSLDAVLWQRPEVTLAAAKRAEDAVMAGEATGPLHGVPFALKDIVDADGWKTTCHSRILADNVAAESATVTAKLEAAGAILLAKLSTHEFALGGPSFDLPWPPARNPWNRDCSPGGSSSGSGAAVAAGMVPMAVGTDTGGSVRNPAGSCNLLGMKATYGRVSRRGVFPLSFSLDHAGPMTRSVEDNALMLQAMAGHDPLDPSSVDEPVPDFTAGLGKDVKDMKLGVIRQFHERDLPADPVVTEALEAALAVYEGLGCEIVEIETTPLSEWSACNRAILTAEAAAVHEAWMIERPQDYAALTRERVLPGALARATDYVQALRLRTRLAEDMERAMRDVDAVFCASSMAPPFRLDDEADMRRNYPRHARTVFNVTGQPALAVPGGFTDDGLPIGFQLAGHAFEEPVLYRLAAAYLAETKWETRRPSIDL